MCWPVAVMLPYIYAGVAAVSAATAVVGIQKQNDAVEDQNEALGKAAQHDYDALARRKGEVDEQTAQDIFQRRLQTQREHGMVVAAQGEAGVAGNSAVRVLGNTIFQGAYDVNRIKTGSENERANIFSQMDSVQSGTQSQINLNSNNGVGGFGAMAQVAGAAAEGYSSASSVGSAFKSTKGLKTFETKSTYKHHRADGLH